MSQTFEQFSKYILLEKIASGGMAEVYLAKSKGANGVNKFVAIKRILPQFSDNPEFIEMFKEEAKIAIHLANSNVVSIYEFGIEKKQFYLVMEFVEGRNLRQILNDLKKSNQYFSLDQIVYLAKEVAAGLDHAHRCIDSSTGKPLNITHRDMSPQNIMLSFEGNVKVIDFGIAKAESQMDSTKVGTLKGKFSYMSPEQAEGENVDLRTDIFSLGIVLWELLANDRLFTSNNESGILRKIKEGQIPNIRKLNPSVPPELEKIVHKALAKDKSLRYQSAAALHRDLNRFLNTHYPEFSSHDFSVFLKNAFSDFYLNQKKKLMEYSQMSFDSEADEEKTVQTKSYTANENSSNRTLTEPDPLDLNLNGAMGADSPPLATANTNPLPVQKPSLQVKKPQSTKQPYQPISIIKSYSDQQEKIIYYGSRAGFAVIALVSLYLLYSQILTQLPWDKWKVKAQRQIISLIGSNKKPASVPSSSGVNQGELTPASKATSVVKIHSRPTGAKIILDGDPQIYYTPKSFTVETNRPFQFRLEKDGFLNYPVTLTPTEPAVSKEYTLSSAAQSGYLYITVDGGSSTYVEVNGVRLNASDLETNYPVPAGQTIIVRARNPVFKLFAQKEIKLKANQRLQVHLVLSPENREPTYFQ